MPFNFPRLLRRIGFHALRIAFRLTPLDEARRDVLRNWFSDRFPHWIPRQKLESTDGPPIERRLRTAADERAIGALPRRSRPLPPELPARLVAFYLPQFHRIPENDTWWGEGFTEWRNVTRALPQFEGHFQPRLPGALGFYDLTDGVTLRRQAELAREYGIGAFCFYFYWFNGRRLLESPLQQWLEDPSLDLPICLCWANEPWTRQWDGRPQDTLIEQRHDPDDDIAFIAHIARYLCDPRYLRVDDRPLVLIYRPGLLPSAKNTIARWREWCRTHGIGEIFIAYVQAFERPDPADIGCDAAVEFPPNLVPAESLGADQVALNQNFSGEILDWRDMARNCLARSAPAYPLFPGVNPSWDNQPRRPGSGRVLLHASPRRYQAWLHTTIRDRLPALPASQRLVFINAWNEWAEGAVLEPDLRWDHAWLDATREALRLSAGSEPEFRADSICAVIHAWYPEVLGELLDALDPACSWRLLVTTGAAQKNDVEALLQAAGHDFEILLCENRGRDILPFLAVAARLRDEGHSILLKLHTKRSPHRADGEAWRQHLIRGVLPKGRCSEVAGRFRQQPELGMLVPAGHLRPLNDHLAGNGQVLDYARRRIGMEAISMDETRFVAGSMFWMRLDALSPLLDAGFMAGEFEQECGQLDGTLAHAIERLFLPVAQAQGWKISVVDGNQEERVPFYPAPY
jgi:lipopolysaccharide biosynthesis protein